MRVAILVGNVGRKPAFRTSKSSLHCNLGVVVDERGKHREPRTEWYDVVACDQLAQTLVHVAPGDELLIVGTFHQVEHTGRDQVRHRSLEIRAWDVRFLRPAERTRGAGAGLPAAAAATAPDPEAAPPELQHADAAGNDGLPADPPAAIVSE